MEKSKLFGSSSHINSNVSTSAVSRAILDLRVELSDLYQVQQQPSPSSLKLHDSESESKCKSSRSKSKSLLCTSKKR